jgi:hypothetical protein
LNPLLFMEDAGGEAYSSWDASLVKEALPEFIASGRPNFPRLHRSRSFIDITRHLTQREV